MNKIVSFIASHPAVITQVTAAIIALCVSFGLRWSTEQTAAIMGVSQMIAALVGEIFTTPTAKADARVAVALATPVPFPAPQQQGTP